MSNARYSIIAARAVFDVDNITATELRVLNALGTYTNDEGWCYPNQTTLAERLKLTRQTISGAIRKLVDKGYVETEVRTAKGRGKVGYNYRVVLDIKRAAALPKADDEQADVGAGRQRQEPTTATADVGADRDPMSAQASVAYKEVTNPSERPQQSSPTSNEVEEDVVRQQRGAYEAAAAAKAATKPRATKARKPTPYTGAFEAIWLAWPKHRRANSDKRKAFARYQSGVEQFGAEAVSAAAKRYLSLPDTRKDQWRYCCLVEVFMNGKLEAAVEAAQQDAAAPAQVLTHDEIERASAERYHAKTGKWPPGYHPPMEARA